MEGGPSGFLTNLGFVETCYQEIREKADLIEGWVDSICAWLRREAGVGLER